MKPIKPFIRDGSYDFRKRAPRCYAAVEQQPFIQLSLRTNRLDIAMRKAP